MSNKDLILCEDIKERISHKFTDYGWTLVSDDDVHSALISDEHLSDALEDYSWDFHIGDGMPSISISYSNGIEGVDYKRFGGSKCEPFVIFRGRRKNHPCFIELSEEFRLYHNLYEEYTSETERKYVIVLNNGEVYNVAEIKEMKVLIKTKYLQQYLADRKINLAIFFDVVRDCEDSLSEMDIFPVDNDVVRGENFIYHYTNIFPFYRDGKSRGGIIGKCIIKHNASFATNILTKNTDDFVSFIVGHDNEGNEILKSCDRKSLPGSSLTPCYFRKEVLESYFSNPSKYTVKDGLITCEGSWSLKVDNNGRDYVIVMLPDMGTLPYKEQTYWKSFNTDPPKDTGLSETAYQRWILGNWFDPISPDFVFKQKYTTFNDAWKAKYGWFFFLPMDKGDEYHLKTLHCLTTPDNEKIFEEQVLSLVKLLIDSLNEKELENKIDFGNSAVSKRRDEMVVSDKAHPREIKGIGKLELFLLSNNIESSNMIGFFRNLQGLRSLNVAHRKSSNSKKPNSKKRTNIEEYFGLDRKCMRDVLDSIFCNCVEIINVISKHFLSQGCITANTSIWK
jgi:hypothetical protein